jgi:hypothetical protein
MRHNKGMHKFANSPENNMGIILEERIGK